MAGAGPAVQGHTSPEADSPGGENAPSGPRAMAKAISLDLQLALDGGRGLVLLVRARGEPLASESASWHLLVRPVGGDASQWAFTAPPDASEAQSWQVPLAGEADTWIVQATLTVGVAPPQIWREALATPAAGAWTPVMGEVSGTTYGSVASILLEDRPMTIDIDVTEGTAVDLPDVVLGTLAAAQVRVERTLAISLEDGSTAGQRIWLNRTWLQEAGFGVPLFMHSDGSPISIAETQTHLLLSPRHFSTVYAFQESLAPFQLVPVQNHGQVAWDSLNSRAILTSQYMADGDVSAIRDFAAPTQYELTSRFGATFGAGNAGRFFPLAVGNKSERMDPPPPGYVESPNGSMGFSFKSGAYWYPQVSHLQAFYTTQYGKRTTLWDWELGYSDDFEYLLRIKVGAVNTTFQLLDTAGTTLRSAAVNNTEIPWGMQDVIFFGAARDCCLDDRGYWVDDVSLLALEGNLVNESFSASPASWTLSGNATWDSVNQTLRLVPNAANQAGRAYWTTGSSATSFAMQFRAKLGPSAAGGEGMAFMFFKDMSYTPAAGNGLGFQDADAGTPAGHEGYGVTLDGAATPSNDDPNGAHMSVVRDGVANHLVSKLVPGLNDGNWHNYSVEVYGNRLLAFRDGNLILDKLEPFNASHDRFGFAAATGATLKNEHAIDDVSISVPPGIALPANSPPAVPGGPVPANAAINVSLSPTFSWTGGDSDHPFPIHTMYLSASNPPTTIVCVTLALTCTTATLAHSTQYYWQVKTTDGLATTSSPVWTFTTTANLPPTIPYDPEPANGTSGIPGRQNLIVRWKGGDPDGSQPTYTVKMGDPPATVACANVVVETCTISHGLFWRGANYWSVSATDGVSTVTGPIWRFNAVELTEANTPAAMDPGQDWWNVETNIPISGNMTWTGGTPDGGPVEYDVWLRPMYTINLPNQIDDVPVVEELDGQQISPNSAVAQCGGDVSLYGRKRPYTAEQCPFGPLAFDTEYSWVVEAYTGYGDKRSRTAYFRTNPNSPPEVPSQPWPPNASTGLSTQNVVLQWTGGDVDRLGVEHVTLLGPKGLPKAPICASKDSPICRVSFPLDRGREYEWQVISTDGILQTTGPNWTFSTQALCLDAAGLLNVPDGLILGGPEDNSRMTAYAPFVQGCGLAVTGSTVLHFLDFETIHSEWTDCDAWAGGADLDTITTCGREPNGVAMLPDGTVPIFGRKMTMRAVIPSWEVALAARQSEPTAPEVSEFYWDRLIYSGSEASDPVNVVFYGNGLSPHVEDVLRYGGPGWNGVGHHDFANWGGGCSSRHRAFIYDAEFGGEDRWWTETRVTEHSHNWDCNSARYHARHYRDTSAADSEAKHPRLGKYSLAPVHWEECFKHSCINFDTGKGKLVTSVREEASAYRSHFSIYDRINPSDYPGCAHCDTDVGYVWFLKLI